MPKPYHHGDLRQSLLDEATSLVEEKGVEGLSLRKIARRAGVSHAAPYRHFEDMAELISAVAEQGFSLLENSMLEACPSCTKPGDRLMEIGVAYVGFALDHRAHFRVMFREHPTPSGGLEDAASKAFGVLAQAVDAGVSQEAFRPLPVEDMARAAWAQVHGIASLALDGLLRGDDSGQVEAKERLLQVTRQTLSILFRGILAEKA
jgi:AcrR family transcriptional regulator